MSEEQKEEQHEMSMQLIQEECAININEKIEHPPVAINKTKEVVTRDGEVKEFPILKFTKK